MNGRSWFAPSSLRALALLAALLLPAVRAHASFLAADPTYMGYRIPEHRWSSWTASVDAFGNHGNGTSFQGQTHAGGFSGRLSTRGTWGYDSDRLQHGWGFAVEANGRREGQRRLDEFSVFTREDRMRRSDLNQRLSVSGSIRDYPWSAPWGVSLSTSHYLELTQSFSSSNSSTQQPPYRDVTADGVARGDRRYDGSATVGIGFGHVRDATPVQRVQILEERLLRSGALTRALSEETRARIAGLFSVQSDVGAAHERPSRYFWREVERVLREDGALASTLGAYEVLYLLDPFYLTATRRTGFFVGPALSVVTSRFRSTNESAFSHTLYFADSVVASTSASNEGTLNARTDDVLTSFQAEFYRPLSPRWQLDGRTTVGIRESGESPFVSTSVAVMYIRPDRWLGIVRGSQFSSAVLRSRHFEYWNVYLAGELYYFLEDSWALRFVTNASQGHAPRAFGRSVDFQIGLTWRLSGFFEAPGLVETMRLTPPHP